MRVRCASSHSPGQTDTLQARDTRRHGPSREFRSEKVHRNNAEDPQPPHGARRRAADAADLVDKIVGKRRRRAATTLRHYVRLTTAARAKAVPGLDEVTRAALESAEDKILEDAQPRRDNVVSLASRRS